MPRARTSSIIPPSVPRAGSAPLAGTARGAARWLRTDWCASAISISTVAPTTSENTPRSKRSALATGTRRSEGSRHRRSTRSGRDGRTARRPLRCTAASKRPKPIQRTGRIRRRASTQIVPRAMYCRMNATAMVTPATNPPPGQVVPAQEQEDGSHADHRKQQPHDQRREPPSRRLIVSPFCDRDERRRRRSGRRCCSGPGCSREPGGTAAAARRR